MSLTQLLLCGYETRTGGVRLLHCHPHFKDGRNDCSSEIFSDFGRMGAFQTCFEVGERAVTTRPQRGILLSQPGILFPFQAPSTTMFSQKSLSPPAPACNHIKVWGFSLLHEQRIPAPGTGNFPEGGMRLCRLRLVTPCLMGSR